VPLLAKRRPLLFLLRFFLGEISSAQVAHVTLAQFVQLCFELKMKD
jgi:hypothetical protein